MSHGELLALAAMKKGLAYLTAKATKATEAVDACTHAASEFIAVQREAFEIMGEVAKTPAASLKKLEALQAKESRARRNMKKDLSKLLDKQFEAENDRDALAEFITQFERRLQMRGVTTTPKGKTK